jgi:hypothetical protein
METIQLKTQNNSQGPGSTDGATELGRMNDLFVGREFRIKELRDRVKELRIAENRKDNPSKTIRGGTERKQGPG